MQVNMTTFVTVVFREQRRRSASDRVVCGTIRSGVKFVVHVIFMNITFYLWGSMPLKVDVTFSPSRNTSADRQTRY